MMDRTDIVRGAKVELAKREFFFYCQAKAPKFYKNNRNYLVELCNEFQNFLASDEEVMIVNIPPRHGKSRTAGLLVEWVLGQDSTQKIITGSYNETLSKTFSKGVRNGIMEKKVDKDRIVFSDVFPGVSIRHGDGAMNLWSLKDGHNNYLATSPTGTATGFGASLMIIDDLIKSALEANNELIKEAQWKWFTDTMLSRLEEGGKIIIIMTRWASDDLAGRALEHYKSIGTNIRHVCMKALVDPVTHEMLCPQILSYKTYQSRILLMGADIASANYQQETINLKGRLYSSFKTYDGELPLFRQIKNYTDTADTGADYLCSINYGETFAMEAYILDVLYTKEPMEVTEPAIAKMLHDGGVNLARIEANNGGRGFARSVRRHLQEDYDSNLTVIKTFTQTKNKQARIYSASSWVMEHMHFPKDWKNRWPDYYDAMVKYQREGKNAHDDAQDATTGVAESCCRCSGIKVLTPETEE